ncbi:MAG TPA: DUF721 domain-containing protein [Ignavibacteria bacterium]|nr:DUF721 domain-containing protein [Ignavibacteria bacterium]
MPRIDQNRFNKTVCLKDELNDFMKHIGLDDRMQDLKILNVWEECVGSSIAKFSEPIRIVKHKLYVKVENSVWRYELSVRKDEIIPRLNQSLNKKLIREIVFI